MNIVFFGSSGFSVPTLKSIAPQITCVVTKRAKPQGRGYQLESSEVQKVALELNLPLIEIDTFKDEAIKKLPEFKPDLFVVVSFGLIIPRWALDIPSIGAINVHPSLLPAYRGPSPIQWVLMSGETETGITLIKMNEKMDAGRIIYQEHVSIVDEDDAVTLSGRLSKRVSEILPEIIDSVGMQGMVEGAEQKHEDATFAPIITKEMGRIDWHRNAVEIVHQIRALVAWPTAYTFLDGLMLKVFNGQAGKGSESKSPGVILDSNKTGISVATGEGLLVLKEVQLQNRKRMSAYDFARGYRDLVGKGLS
jgi:methionyl-tRNA formyltransferase